MKSAELCAGYGGLALAIEKVFGTKSAWFSEFEEAPSRILAHHWPTVPNLGDMTKIDWRSVEPVQVLGAGTPCQDLSTAGRRSGMTEGTRSNLAVEFLHAVEIIRPEYVVWENVRGAYSAKADSDLEFCPGCMGDAGDGRVVLRALGRLLGNLSDLGYDTQWRGLRAADVGGCHGRFRVFVLAANRDRFRRERPRDSRGRWARLADSNLPTSHASRLGRREGRPESARLQRGSNAPIRRSEDLPNTISGGRARWPRAARWEAQQRTSPERSSEGVAWREYELFVRAWERITRPAPRPTEPTGRNGNHRLSPFFTEWMMGLPEGWVTDPAIGLTRNEQIKACGNGVVPQQAVAALSDMLQAFNRLEVAA